MRIALFFGVLVAIGVIAALVLRVQSVNSTEMTTVAESSEATTADEMAAGRERENANTGVEGQDRKELDLTEVVNRPIRVPAGGYVGAEKCTRCHAEQHQSWHASFHSTMTQVITPETAPECLDDSLVTVQGDNYQFTRRGEQYFVKLDDPVDSSDAVVEKELVLMTGSHHMHAFWFASPYRRTPALLPIVYLLDQQRWIRRDSALIRPPGPVASELGRWNDVCSRCHSTHPRGRMSGDGDYWDTHVGDFGIACESCHGPGEGHIEFHDNKELANDLPADVSSGGDGKDGDGKNDVVVSPEDLPHELKSDVCGQCHSVHRHDFAEYDVEEFLTQGIPFRPGEDFEKSPLQKLMRATPEVQEVVKRERPGDMVYLQNTFWIDGTVRVSGREYSGMIESACFKQGEMSCLSCHEMHPDASTDLATWRDDQLKPGMRANHACTQCHSESQYTTELVQHTHHPVDSEGSNCMNCHMPPTVFGLLKAIRSHRIESPSTEMTLTTGRPNGCVLCHLDQSLQWSSTHLTQWYDQKSYEFEHPMAGETAAGVVNLMLGSAGIRALYASAYGWKPAQEASGTDWMAPYLMIELLDEYDANRIVALRTLRTLPGYEDIEFDELADARSRGEAVNKLVEKFKREQRLKPRPGLLIGDDGMVDFQTVSQMFNARDRTPISLDE